MKKALLIIVAFITLSTLACGLTGSRTGDGEGTTVAVSTQAPAESGGEQPEPASDPTSVGDSEEAADERTATRPAGSEEAADEGTATQPTAALGAAPFEFAPDQIPEGYPTKEFPVYEQASSTVLGGFRQSVDDVPVYNLVIGSDDDVQTVTESIRNTFEAQSAEFEEMIGGGMFMGSKDGWDYVIVINSGEEDGFGTLVTYMLTRQE